ncbi:hypothetical protein M422DRAFT_265496 [Sphaerobolus stellatus SS14]|uniref:Unplaced genomic scaffold SPHSTscaffold_149, whole genome shotgun sequence n=1 Tax=Sphaerobolus stellatus (strain SS14) TaxID=990650 RepID=A0A0C9UD11_SPHS4|nr:hypothetical protein M422DRAFT_265496 [Sphaerobolus stellatus SS14]
MATTVVLEGGLAATPQAYAVVRQLGRCFLTSKASVSATRTDLDWQLADLTPRKLILDAGFISDLRHILGWTSIRDPVLADLHPSFGNLDHTGQFINKLRDELFPNGTGLEGESFITLYS